MQICDKPFKTYDELIDKMIEKHIIVEDKQFAKQALLNCSYYNLVNRYQHILASPSDPTKFVQGVTFEQLYTLYTLDMSLSNILLKYILYIEKSLKSKLSYVVSEAFGESTTSSDGTYKTLSGYLDRKNYSTSNKLRDNTIRKIFAVLDYAQDPHSYRIKYNKKEYISESLKHYASKHNHIPPWILTTSLMFGQVENWYSILKSSEKTEVVKSFIPASDLSDEEKKEFLKKSLVLLRSFRNSIAHGGQITKPYKDKIPKMQLVLLSHGLLNNHDYMNSKSAQSGIHALICTIIALINDEYLESSIIQDLYTLFIEYDNDEILINSKRVWCHFGLPNDFMFRIRKEYNILMIK